MRDAEQRRGNRSEDVTVEGFGFVEINQVCCGHLEGLVRVGAGESAELLSKGIVADELPARRLAGSEKDR
jgi:hypothetical protein